MEQPCYKCGRTVEEGRVFCPHCSAPQIRVLVAEPAIANAGPLNRASASETVPLIAIPTRWSMAAQPCAVAALIAAIVMVLKLIVPVIAAIGAGFLAVALYRRRNPEIPMQARTGARIGAICGLFCSAMTAILAAVRVALLHEGGAIRATILEAIQQSTSRYSDPQYQAGVDFMRSDAGLALMMVVSFIVGLIAITLLSTLGGAISGASLGRRDRS
jgi:hypothetical protein